MITGVAHVCFLVRNLDISVAFYREVLGLTPAFDFVNEETRERFGLYLHVSGRTFIELFQGMPESGQGSYQHLCLEVDDIDRTVATLRAKGAEVTDPFLACDQTWQAWLSDPDGNRIELHQYTPESWQAPALR